MCNIGGLARRLAVLVDVAQHGDPRHGMVTRITGGSLHDMESCTARGPAAQVDGTASAVGRYNWRTGRRLSHGTGLCTVFVLARQYSARYLAPCKTVALDIASHRTSRAALRDCIQTVLAFCRLIRTTFNWYSTLM